MTQGRILPLLGPLLVLYLVLEVAGSSASVDLTAALACAVAVGLAALPFWALRGGTRRAGARRVSLLGVAAGVALVRYAEPGLDSLYLDLGAAIALPAVGGLAAHLAIDIPDAPPAIASRRRALVALLVAAGIVGGVMSILAVGPVLPLGDELLVVPARWVRAGPAVAAGGVVLAIGLRLVRRRLGSSPEALAAGSAAHLGAWVALGLCATAIGLAFNDPAGVSGAPARLALVAGALALAVGHAAMLGVRRQVHAGRNTRLVLAGAVTLGGIGAGVASLAGALPPQPFALGVAAAAVLLLGAALNRLVTAGVDRALAPFGGRLLRASDEALTAAVGATSLDELGQAVLPPLRRASDTLDADPLLLCFDPPREVRVDAASVAHVEGRESSEALRAWLHERPGEVIVTAPLLDQVVRRAELRGLAEALDRMDALCVVPLSMDFESVGALVVPRGRRRSALTLEEIDRLERLGRHLSGQVAMLAANERARGRTRDAVNAREEMAERLELAQEELARLRADTRTLKAGGAAERYTEPAIGYSPAMRALTRKIEEVGPLSAPALLLGEEGAGLDRVGHLLHASGGRREGPFVVADCAAVRPERADAALFGESDARHPGWLRLAEGGTCLLLDVPALSLESQAKLAEALATRRGAFADGAGSYPIDARVVATSRVPLGPLAEAGTFDAELLRRLDPLTLRVPPLRERVADLPSLVLLALDRACRTTGRPVLGIDAAAQKALEAHHWPGNLAELRAVIDHAVERATHATVRLEDLPPLAPAPQVTMDPLDGTYAEVERRLLEAAIARADGNKSEAARALGLKRTTFLDKLKRYGLSQPPPPAKKAAKARSRADESSPPL